MAVYELVWATCSIFTFFFTHSCSAVQSFSPQMTCDKSIISSFIFLLLLLLLSHSHCHIPSFSLYLGYTRDVAGIARYTPYAHRTIIPVNSFSPHPLSSFLSSSLPALHEMLFPKSHVYKLNRKPRSWTIRLTLEGP